MESTNCRYILFLWLPFRLRYSMFVLSMTQYLEILTFGYSWTPSPSTITVDAPINLLRRFGFASSLITCLGLNGCSLSCGIHANWNWCDAGNYPVVSRLNSPARRRFPEMQCNAGSRSSISSIFYLLTGIYLSSTFTRLAVLSAFDRALVRFGPPRDALPVLAGTSCFLARTCVWSSSHGQ